METTAETITNSEKQQTNEEEAALVKNASDLFEAGNFESCLEILKKLEETIGNSTCLQHNRAVVEFYNSGCTNHKALLHSLDALDPKTDEDFDDSTNVSALNPIAKYNKAVIYFHRHMYMAAIRELEPVVKKFDLLEKSHAELFGSLMLRLLLITNQLKKSLAFLDVLRTHSGLNADGIKTEDQSEEEQLKNLDAPRKNFKLLYMLTQVLNRKLIVIPDDDTPEFGVLKGHQYYLMKDFQMASKQFAKITVNDLVVGKELSTCIANNMGIIHLRVRHYALATKFFQTALIFNGGLSRSIRNVTLFDLSAARSIEICFNMGVSMLHLRRPKEAFQCFLIPLKAYHSNPRLWLRLAESCIMDHEMNGKDNNKKPTLIQVNVGGRKKYVLQPPPRVNYAPISHIAGVPEATIDFAVLCLRNALTLTKAYKQVFFESSNESATTEETMSENSLSWNNVDDHIFCNPSPPISKDILERMLSSIYAAYSYVSLRVGDYVTALEMAQELLKSEKLTDAHKLLAHMYAGEALIMMDKLPDSRPHLDPTFVSSLNAFDFETQDWQLKSLDAAQNVVRYNLAIAMVLQGDFGTAMSLLQTCAHPIVVPKAMQLKMFLDIRIGKVA